MRNLLELNINEGGRAISRPAPTEAEINAFEAHFGVTLPPEYLALLRYANGGHPEANSIVPTGALEAERLDVNRFYHIGSDRTRLSNLWYATGAWRNVLGPKSVPFASDSGGSQFFFDLISSQPAVKFCIHDQKCRVIDVARSFSEFVDNLSVDPEAI